MNKRIAVIITLLTVIGLPVMAEETPTATITNEAATPSLRSKETVERAEAARRLKEAAKGQIKGARGAVKADLSKIRVELKNRLIKIKDERKKTMVIEIDERLPKFNKIRTDHFTAVVGKLKTALERVVARTAKVEARKLDVSSVKAAINEAKTAISAAEAAIATQATKQYSATFTSEKTLRQEIKAARDLVRSDLKVVQDLVKAAQESVRKAAVALAQVVKPAQTVTSTVNQ